MVVSISSRLSLGPLVKEPLDDRRWHISTSICPVIVVLAARPMDVFEDATVAYGFKGLSTVSGSSPLDSQKSPIVSIDATLESSNLDLHSLTQGSRSSINYITSDEMPTFPKTHAYDWDVDDV